LNHLVERGFCVFVRSGLHNKDTRKLYEKKCTYITPGDNYEKLSFIAALRFYQDEGYHKIQSQSQIITNNDLLQSLEFIDNINITDSNSSEMSKVRYVLDEQKLFLNLHANQKDKKQYKTLVFNTKRGESLLNSLSWYPRLLDCENHIIYRKGDIEGDVYASFGLPDPNAQSKLKKLSNQRKAPYFNIENGFLAFAGIALLGSAKSHSLLLDTSSLYFDGVKGSSTEDRIMMATELDCTAEKEIRFLIEKIITNRLTKYNYAAINDITLPGNNQQKILVIDQRFGDKSIEYACANEHTFKKMLLDAHEENPKADIIVKVHPDALTGIVKGHYSKSIEEMSRVYFYTDDVNPLSLLSKIDSVYVVSSQMGFEALMLDKNVKVYGHAIYGGWGLTDDRIEFKRRNQQKRTLEQVFKCLYIDGVPYVSHVSGEKINLNEYLDSLVQFKNVQLTKPKLINMGDGHFTFNPITGEYFIEKEGKVTFNTLIALLSNIEKGLRLELAVNILENHQVEGASQLTTLLCQFLNNNISEYNFVAQLKKHPKQNEVYKILVTFSEQLNIESILSLIDELIYTSKSELFINKVNEWGALITEKKQREQNNKAHMQAEVIKVSR
jgi:hypothetical protein